jgi:hypothetical protein
VATLSTARVVVEPAKYPPTPATTAAPTIVAITDLRETPPCTYGGV